LGGAQIGYNWQVAPHWVWGIEADWQWTRQRDSSCVEFCARSPDIGLFFVTLDQSLKWFATARARIGYAQDRWLWYVTGGAALGQVNDNFANVVPNPALLLGQLGGGISVSHNMGGWVAGVGVEAALGGNWSAKLEYLYMSLGSVTDQFTLNQSAASGAGGPETFTARSDIRDHIVRAGLNYKFSWGGPVTTKY
jgi:outer membrane immunogenic protein